MSFRLCCCLIAFAVTSYVAADFVHVAVNESQRIILRCHQSKQGEVTWSREKNGSFIKIITIGVEADKIHVNDPLKRYHSQADKSLIIMKAEVSDSGRYNCSNERAVELTVIPSGTKIQKVKEREKVTLKCPGKDKDKDDKPDDKKWSRMFGELTDQRFQTKEKKLIIKDAKQEDTGLYYCGRKPAVFLNVTRRSTSATTRKTSTMSTATSTTTTTSTTTSTTTRTTTSTATSTATTTSTTTPTTTRTTTSTATKPTVLYWLIPVGALIFLIIIITTAYFTWRQKCKKQEAGTECHVYEEITEASRLQPDSDVINQSNAIYSLITDTPKTPSKPDSPYSLIGPCSASRNNQDSPYSLIGPSPSSGDDRGSSLPSNSTYCLLEKPKVPTNLNEQLELM